MRRGSIQNGQRGRDSENQSRRNRGGHRSSQTIKHRTTRCRADRAAPANSVGICEAGATLALTRLYGRASPGERVVDSVPQNYGSSQTMLGCLSLDGVSAPWVIEGAVDGEVFLN